MMKEKNVRVGLTGLQMKITGSVATIQVLTPMRDDHPCYAVVGRIAAETARIEFLLDQSIANAADMDRQQAACITGQLIGPVPRFTALYQLCRHRSASEEILSRINKLSGQASGLFERRNRAVHDPWLEDKDTGISHQFRGKPKKSPAWGTVPVSEQQLNDDLTELRRLRDDVNQLVGDIWTALKPS